MLLRFVLMFLNNTNIMYCRYIITQKLNNTLIFHNIIFAKCYYHVYQVYLQFFYRMQKRLNTLNTKLNKYYSPLITKRGGLSSAYTPK